jgi:choline monooxygenase
MKIDDDIRKAYTLPASFYRDRTTFEALREKVFASTWHYVADANVVRHPGAVYPFTLLEGVLDEPLLLSRDLSGRLHCLSNVCTHRGKIIVESAGNLNLLSCGYHGRCFYLDGRFRSMPKFSDADNFPSEEDHLPQIAVQEWLGMIFVSLHPAFSLEEAVRPIMDRVGFLPLHSLRFTEDGTKDYFIRANWALYCDNYLEGFHIPFVHPALNEALDFGKYEYELFSHCNLQTGIADEDASHFEVPASSPDAGKKVYAWYFWLFPNLMLNFYPWGLSLNIVNPLNHEQTRVRFRTYRFEGLPYSREENQLDKTEMEDEQVVESVQKGIQSRYYHRGRFSPSMEKGVHHFHRLLAEFML